MATTELFFDLSLGSGGSGTAADPFGSMQGIRWVNDMRLRFRRGKVHRLLTSSFGGISVPASVTGGIEITDFGDSLERATLDGSREYTQWTRYNDTVWYVTGVPATAGVVRQNGIALDWVHGKDGVGSFAPRMTPGSYALDHSGGVYVWLRDGADPNSPDEKVEIALTPLGIWVGGRQQYLQDLYVSGLHLTGFSRQGSNVEMVANGQFVDNVVQYTGGYWDPNGQYYLGGGLQVGGGCRNMLYERNSCTDVYDSPMSPQLYRANTQIDGVTMRNNVLGNFALGGVEIAIWSQGCSISNVTIEDNYIFGGGKGFSGTGDNIDNTEGVIINGLSSFSNIRIERNIIENIDHSGIEVRDAKSTGIYLLRNKISGCRYGIRNFSGNPIAMKVVAAFNEVSGCSQYGIVHDQRLGSVASEYRKNTLVDNGVANLALLKVNTTAPVVKDNNSYGAQYGIQKTGNLNVAVQFNNVYAASSADYVGVQVDPSNLAVEPDFVDSTNGDYQLAAGSKLIGAASGSSSGLDLIGQSYMTDDIGCHARTNPIIETANRVDLLALTA